jgi:hypothetical protein
MATEPFCRHVIRTTLEGLWRCPTDDLSQHLRLDRVVGQLDLPVNLDPVFWPYIIRLDVHQRGVAFLTIPPLQDSPNSHDATGIDIHETHIIGIEFGEFLPMVSP